MKIAIFPDSRGANRKDIGIYSWVDFLKEKRPQDQYMFSMEGSCSFRTMFEHYNILKQTNEKYDIGIVQLGLNEYIVPWRKCIWDTLVPDFDPDYMEHLTEATQFPLYLKIYETNLGYYYNYRNDDVIKEMFNKFRQYCKKIVFITMPYSWAEFYDNTVIMNKVFSENADIVVPLSMKPEFPSLATPNNDVDRVHYLEHYARALGYLIAEYY